MKDMDTCNVRPLDFDLVNEVITEDMERHRGFPPPPLPPHSLYQPHADNHVTLHPSSSPPPPSAPRPKLVARGTAPQPIISPRDMAHPTAGLSSASRRGRNTSCLPGSKGSAAISAQSQIGDTQMLERILQKPKLVVVEEPKERGMRFRYQCEGRSAGSILGASSTENNKTQPTIEIQGPIDHIKRVTVTVSLVTKDLPHRPHPHCLVGKDCPNTSGICVVSFNPQSTRRHSFANLGIQCVRRKELDVSLQKRRSQNIDPFQTGNTKGIEDMDMNAVRLCFQCELEWDDGKKDCLSPVVSNPIYDKKATTTSQLKISCLNQYRGSCAGKTEIYMLCDKVQKDDIEIIFRHGSWKASGEFAQTDVHRQIAIVFKTPPYQDQDITEEVEVSVSLRRLSDQMESEPISFTYLPHNPDPYEVKRKRKIKSDISFRDKSCGTAQSAPAVELPLSFPPARPMIPEERPCTASLPGPSSSGLGDMTYSELQDSSNGNDETIINQLLEMPALWEIISDPTFTTMAYENDPGATAAFPAMDTNVNMGSYPQDFSHYNDLQFNMLVMENQTPQTEEQDASDVQVKVEEELL